MEKSSFFNSVQASDGSYDREYLAEDFAKYFASFIGNGVFPNPSTNLQVFSNNDMTISIDIGKAYINGYYYENTTKLVKTIDVADGVLNRVDLIVLRLDFTNREIKTYVKKGTFASSPKAETLQRDSDIYELGLAEVYVKSGATTITQANITDLRLDADNCGVVSNAVTSVDASSLYNQYESLFNQKITKNQDDFNAWFENIKNQLSVDAAGNLQNEIDSLNINKVDYVDMTPKTTEGTASAYTVELSDAMNEVTIIPHVDNEEGATLNGLSIKDSDGNYVKANKLKADIPIKLVRVGSNFFICSGQANSEISLLDPVNYNEFSILNEINDFVYARSSVTSNNKTGYKVYKIKKDGTRIMQSSWISRSYNGVPVYANDDFIIIVDDSSVGKYSWEDINIEAWDINFNWYYISGKNYPCATYCESENTIYIVGITDKPYYLSKVNLNDGTTEGTVPSHTVVTATEIGSVINKNGEILGWFNSTCYCDKNLTKKKYIADFIISSCPDKIN